MGLCLSEFARDMNETDPCKVHVLTGLRFAPWTSCSNPLINNDLEKRMKIAGMILAIIGVLLLGLGGYLFVKERLFLQNAEQTTAVVTGNERYTYESNDYGTQHYYCSEFQFQTREGQRISFKESDDSNTICGSLDFPPDFQEGEQVAAYYDPQDPVHSVQIPKSIRQNYNGVGVLVVLGTIALLGGLALFWSGILRGRRPASSGQGWR